MAQIIQTKALILRHRDDREADRWLVILTPTMGQQQIRARGTKKGISKLGGSLTPVTEVDLTLANGRRIDVVTGSIVLRRWPKVRQELVTFLTAQWLLELVERVSKPNQPELGLYPLVTDMLTTMEAEVNWTPGAKWVGLLRRAWIILQHEGFAPDLNQCGLCHRPIGDEPRAFDPRHGWLHAAEASSEAQMISAASIAYLQTGVMPSEPKDVWRELYKLVQSVIEHTLDRPLQSESVLQRVMRSAWIVSHRKPA